MTTVKPSRRRWAESAVASAPSIRSSAARAATSHGFKREVRRILDVGEVNLRFDRRHGLEEASTDRLALAAQRPARDALRLSPLRLGFGLDQIGDPLHLGKIDLSIHESAPGEFSGLGRTQSGNKRQRPDDRGRDRPPARDADFRHFLAGEAAGRLKSRDQRPIERLTRAEGG